MNAVKFLPNGLAIATGSDDASCRLFDIRAETELATYTDDMIREGVTSIDVSHSGRFLIASYDDPKRGRMERDASSESASGVRIWDVLKCEKAGGLPDLHEAKVSAVRVSPDGKAIATASWDSTVRVRFHLEKKLNSNKNILFHRFGRKSLSSQEF